LDGIPYAAGLQLIHASAINEGAETIWVMESDIADVIAIEDRARLRKEAQNSSMADMDDMGAMMDDHDDQ